MWYHKRGGKRKMINSLTLPSTKIYDLLNNPTRIHNCTLVMEKLSCSYIEKNHFI